MWCWEDLGKSSYFSKCEYSSQLFMCFDLLDIHYNSYQGWGHCNCKLLDHQSTMKYRVLKLHWSQNNKNNSSNISTCNVMKRVIDNMVFQKKNPKYVPMISFDWYSPWSYNSPFQRYMIIFSVTYFLEFYSAKSFYYWCNYLSSKVVNFQTTNLTFLGEIWDMQLIVIA